MDSALVRLYGATFLYTLAMAVGIPLVPEYLKLEFGASVTFVGIVLGVYGAMQIFLRLPMGDMADRKGRKPSLLAAFGFSLIAGVLLLVPGSVWWVVPAVASFGLAGGIFWVAANAYLFDRVGDGDASQATSDYGVVIGLAFLVGPPLGHYVADTYGWGAAFFTFVWTSVLGAILVATLPEIKPPPKPKPTTSPYVRAWALLKHPALVLSAIGTLLYSSLFATMNAFFQLHALAVGIGITAIGLLLGGRQLAATVVRFRLPALLRKVGARRFMLGGVAVMALSTLAVPYANGLVGLAIVVAIAGAASGVLIPANLMLVHEGAPKEQRGLANGIYGTMLGVGSAIAPIAYGALGGALGLPWTFWSAGLVALALTLAVVVTPRRAPEPTAEPQA